MINFFSQIVDSLNKNLSFLSIGLKLFFKFRTFQQFLLEIELSEQISFVVVESVPDIIYSVSESLDLFSGYW